MTRPQLSQAPSAACLAVRTYASDLRWNGISNGDAQATGWPHEPGGARGGSPSPIQHPDRDLQCAPEVSSHSFGHGGPGFGRDAPNGDGPCTALRPSKQRLPAPAPTLSSVQQHIGSAPATETALSRRGARRPAASLRHAAVQEAHELQPGRGCLRPREPAGKLPGGQAEGQRLLRSAGLPALAALPRPAGGGPAPAAASAAGAAVLVSTVQQRTGAAAPARRRPRLHRAPCLPACLLQGKHGLKEAGRSTGWLLLTAAEQAGPPWVMGALGTHIVPARPVSLQVGPRGAQCHAVSLPARVSGADTAGLGVLHQEQQGGGL